MFGFIKTVFKKKDKHDEIEFVKSEKLFRMPVQRVFSSQGFGTVVTGVPSDGEIAVGSEVEILGGKERQSAKIRGLQVFGQSINKAISGHRLALNLQGISVDSISRGYYIVEKNAYRQAKILSCKIEILKSFVHFVKNTLDLTVYIGTGRYTGKLIILDNKKQLAPGDSAFVQLRFQQSIPACIADRLILRDYSNQLLIGGGVVLKLSDEKPRGKRDIFIRNLSQLEKALADPKMLVLEIAKMPEISVVSKNLLRTELGLKPDVAKKYLEELHKEGALISAATGYLAADKFAQYKSALIAMLKKANESKPFRFWHNKAHFISQLRIPVDIGETVVKELVKEGKIEIKQNLIRLSNYEPKLNDAQKALAEKVLAEVAKGGAAPMLAHEFERDWKITDAEDILEYWAEKGELKQINQNFYVTPDVHQRAIEVAVELLREHPSFTVSEYRETLGTSRKFALPILLHLDNLGVTRLDESERVKGLKFDQFAKS